MSQVTDQSAKRLVGLLHQQRTLCVTEMELRYADIIPGNAYKFHILTYINDLSSDLDHTKELLLEFGK